MENKGLGFCPALGHSCVLLENLPVMMEVLRRERDRIDSEIAIAEAELVMLNAQQVKGEYDGEVGSCTA